MGDRCLLVFTKPPVPGLVKTRLIGDLSATDAADLHSAMVEDVVAAVLPGRYQTIVAWALDNGLEVPADWPEPGLRHWQQCGEDLGERLYRGLSRACEEFRSVCVIGTDHPGLDCGRVEKAFEALEKRSEIVLGPATDGGYYLLGIRAQALSRRLFEGIDWSTSRVLSQTRARCSEAGLSVHSLAIGRDVDTAEDVRDLELRLRAGRLEAPRVAQLLAGWQARGERES